MRLATLVIYVMGSLKQFIMLAIEGELFAPLDGYAHYAGDVIGCFTRERRSITETIRTVLIG